MMTQSVRALSGGLGCLALAVLEGCNAPVHSDPGAGSGVKAVSAGAFHTCALMNDLTVSCWGFNMDGALGDGTDIPRMSPGPVMQLSGVARISAGYFNSCAHLGDGTIRCWGDNYYGQIGIGTPINTDVPRVVLGGTALQDLSLGKDYACGLWPDGSASCWGLNDVGQLGDGTKANRSTPAQPGLAGVTQVAAGRAQSCAVMLDGTVDCWGGVGVLGDGTTTEHLSPAPVAGLSNVVQVGQGDASACAMTGDGQVECWGDNSYGQLGNGTAGGPLNVPFTPQLVPLTQVTQLAVGDKFNCALLGDGTVSCWGNNDFGQLGDGTRISHPSPQLVPGLTGVVQISAGTSEACAVTDLGALLCWGDELAYISGNGGGPNANRLTPTPIRF